MAHFTLTLVCSSVCEAEPPLCAGRQNSAQQLLPGAGGMKEPQQ